jgi:hypothetical protein
MHDANPYFFIKIFAITKASFMPPSATIGLTAINA